MSRKPLAIALVATLLLLLPLVGSVPAPSWAQTVNITKWKSPVPSGYDIFLSAGQSNKMTGASFDSGLDVSDSRIYQILNTLGTPGTLSASGANDPLDHYPDGPAATFIGHDVHFLKDFYLANGYLLSPRKAVIVPQAKGGSAVNNAGQWGALGGPLTAVTANAGSLIEIAATRANSALALAGTNSVKALLWHQGEADYQAYGNSLQTGVVDKYRWQLLRTFLYLRQHINANMPIVTGRLTQQSIDSGFALYSKNGVLVDGIIKATVNRVQYSGLADSQSPSALGASSVHFTAAEQRTFAGRYWTGYLAALANNFATGTTWDGDDYRQSSLGYPSGYTLTNSNRDISGDANSGWKTALATHPKTAGRWYAEFKVQAMSNSINLGMIGFQNSDKALHTSLGDTAPDSISGPSKKDAGMWDANGAFVQGLTQVWSGNLGARSAGDVYMLALDITSGKVWIGKNNAWGNSGNPAAGTNPWVTGLVNGEMYFLACSIYTGTGNTWRLQTSAAQQTYSPPSGFSPWDQ